MKLLSQYELITLRVLAEKGDKDAISKLYYYSNAITEHLQNVQSSIEKLHDQLKPTK